MVREIGISLFLACVGLGAGKGFIETIINEGGYVWIAYGAIITLLPLLIVGIIGRYVYKLNYYTLIGVLSGATTNPPALAYSNDLTSCDAPAVGLCHRLSAYHVFTCTHSTNINIGTCLIPPELLQIHITVGVNLIHSYGSKSPPLSKATIFFINLKTYIK